MKHRFLPVKALKMRTKILFLCITSILMALFFLTALFQNSSSKLLYEQTRYTALNNLKNMYNDIYNIINGIEMRLTEIYNEETLLSDKISHTHQLAAKSGKIINILLNTLVSTYLDFISLKKSSLL